MDNGNTVSMTAMIKNLHVNESVTFPLCFRRTVRARVYDIQRDFPGRMLTTDTTTDRSKIIVTRRK